MNKKVLGMFVSVLAVMAVAGISYGVTMKLKASDNDVYKDRVTAKKSFKFKGEELSYVDPDDADPLYYEKIAYKDGDDYKECISKEEAITKAKDFVLQKYGESDWGEITAYEKT